MMEKIEIRKILAMILVSIMVCASVVIVMPNNKVVAEDSAKPLAGLSSGYPTTLIQENLDSDQSTVNGGPLGPVQQGTSIGYIAQGFQVTTNGDLTRFKINLNSLNAGGWFYYDVRENNPGPTSTVIGGLKNIAKSGLSTGWNEFILASPPSLITGTQYYLVFTGSASPNEFYPNINVANPYPLGDVLQAADDILGSYSPYSGGGVDITFQTYIESTISHPGINKVAWHSDGSYALGVTAIDGDDEIWKYTRQTGIWQSEYNLDGGNTFNDIKYSSNFNLFYIVGKGAVPLGFSYYEPTGSLANLNAPIVGGAYFNGLCLADQNGAEDFAFLGVGYNSNTNDPYAAWYNQSTHVWTEVNSGWSGADEIMYDVTWDHGATGSPYYAVGENVGSGAGVIYYFNDVGINKTNLFDTSGWDGTPGPLFGIDWQPAGASDHAIMVGEEFDGGNIWKFNGTYGESLMDNSNILNDVCFHPDGSMAMVVGYNAGNEGVIYHYNPENNEAITKMSTDGDYGKLYGVDVKAWTSPSSGLIVGASGAVGSFLSAADSGTTLTVNAAFPHMYAIDMWKTSDATETSTLNAQVDIDETYTFYTEVNYTIAGVDELFDVGNNNNTFIDLTAWYDEGTEAAMPASDDTHRTKKFVARFFEGTAGTGGVAGTMIYPTASPGTDEVLFDSVGCSGPFGGDDRYAVWINVSFGRQMRAAAGPFGGASGDIFDSGNSFNSGVGQDSWNFQMEVFDNDFPGASNTTYEEFGTFMYTNISIAGNPSANAPPGTVSELMAPNSFITYSANTPYYVNVSIPDLTSGGNIIAATEVNISLVNTAYPAGFDYDPYTEINASWGPSGRPFAAADSERMVWGNLSMVGNELVNPTDNGTIAHGPWGSDFNGYGDTEINWWVSVPGATPEGIYQATITFKIGYW